MCCHTLTYTYRFLRSVWIFDVMWFWCWLPREMLKQLAFLQEVHRSGDIFSCLKIILLSSCPNLPTIIEDLHATNIGRSLMRCICEDIDIVLKTVKDIGDCHMTCIVGESWELMRSYPSPVGHHARVDMKTHSSSFLYLWGSPQAYNAGSINPRSRLKSLKALLVIWTGSYPCRGIKGSQSGPLN